MTAPYAALDALQNSQAIEIYWLNLCVDHGSSALGVAMVCSPSVLQSTFPILTKAHQLKAERMVQSAEKEQISPPKKTDSEVSKRVLWESSKQ